MIYYSMYRSIRIDQGLIIVFVIGFELLAWRRYGDMKGRVRENHDILISTAYT